MAEVFPDPERGLPPAEAFAGGRKGLNPRPAVLPVPGAEEAVRPSETEGSRRGGMEGSMAVRDPHPSISGGTALGAAPHGAGGTKSRTAPEKDFTLERSTDVNRWSKSGEIGRAHV